MLDFDILIAIRKILQIQFCSCDIFAFRNSYIWKGWAWLDFLKVLVIIHLYLCVRKNPSNSLFKSFLLFRELYKSFYQEKRISWISLVGYWTVANVPLQIPVSDVSSVNVFIHDAVKLENVSLLFSFCSFGKSSTEHGIL